MKAKLAAALAALMAVAFFAVPAHATPAPGCVPQGTSPGRILFMGDSITAAIGDAPRLRQLLDAACVSYEIFNAGVGGINSGDTATAAPQLIVALHPNLIIYGPGTNDDPNGFEARYGSGITAMRTWGGSALNILPEMLQSYMCPPAASWVCTSEPAKIDAIYRQTFDMVHGKFAPNIIGYSNRNRIPSTTQYIDPVGGIHPTAAGLVAIQEQEYLGMAGRYGLPALTP
jgi:hypothetical protein